ncbi:MAG: erythromycin biosynthesis sensory transduction protein eryC1, partial [Chloroflexi bacterium]|nr:erythromycin biosynthesis sensory transduction protein eryC1 [Chloroflexota bacterium]
NEVKGFNSRLDPIQAAVLRVKLRYLDEWNTRRREIARRYLEVFAASSLVLPMVPNWAEPVWHLFVVQHPERDEMVKRLNEAGVGTLIHYPIPPHLQQAYTSTGYKIGDFPITEAISRKALSLPIGPQLSVTNADSVIDAIYSDAV